MDTQAAERIDAEYGEADLEGERLGAREPVTVFPPPWEPGQSDIQALVVPGHDLPGQDVPGTIEAAVLSVVDRVPGPAPLPRADER